MIHCSGGAQTKILHFIKNLHVIKDNMFDLPPLFRLIQEESGTEWKEMYKVFNMGHRMELYVSKEIAQDIITISESFNVDAKVIGRVEGFEGKKLTDIFIYSMCLGKFEFGPLDFQKNKEGKLNIRRNIDLEYFSNQPEYVWMMVAVALDETRDKNGKPTMDIFKEPKKITDICEKYANGGIGELIRIAEDVQTDDLFRGYAKKLRELIETKSKR